MKALNYHPTLFRVALYNDYASSVSASTLQDLLSALLAEFRTWFMNNYSVNLSGTEAIADVSGYDYTQQMIIIRQEIRQQMRLAAEIAEKEPAFRSPEAYGGLEQYENLQNTDATRIEAMISLYALSRDPDQLKRQAFVTGDFVSMLNAYNQENLNDHTVSMSAVRYQAPKILSGAFAKRVLKTAALVCMAGMMLCLCYIIAVQWKSRKN